MKTCIDCGNEKPVAEFYCYTGSNRPISYCKPCSTVRAAKWQAANKERRNQRERAARKADPEKYRNRDRGRARDYTRPAEKAKNHRRRARLTGAPINDFTAIEWADLLIRYRSRCAYCGIRSERLEIDHVIPLVKGGAHTMSNIVPACLPCNRQKGTATAMAFARGTR